MSQGVKNPDLPRVKPCEWCGRAFSRDERKHPCSDKIWLAKRFCGNDCGRAAKSVFLRGLSMEEHPGWKGDAAVASTGNGRATRLYPDSQPCEACGDPETIRHHRDENPLNNEPDNIVWFCRPCHAAWHKMGGDNGRCTVDGCDHKHKALGLCDMHYQRQGG